MQDVGCSEVSRARQFISLLLQPTHTVNKLWLVISLEHSLQGSGSNVFRPYIKEVRYAWDGSKCIVGGAAPKEKN